MQSAQFIQNVQERAGVDRDEAQRAVEATLTALSERLTWQEAEHVAAQLPQDLQRCMETKSHEKRWSLEQFLHEVASIEGCDDDEARTHARAVVSTLAEAVSPGEMQDVLSQLPPAYGELMDTSTNPRPEG